MNISIITQSNNLSASDSLGNLYGYMEFVGDRSNMITVGQFIDSFFNANKENFKSLTIKVYDADFDEENDEVMADLFILEEIYIQTYIVQERPKSESFVLSRDEKFGMAKLTYAGESGYLSIYPYNQHIDSWHPKVKFISKHNPYGDTIITSEAPLTIRQFFKEYFRGDNRKYDGFGIHEKQETAWWSDPNKTEFTTKTGISSMSSGGEITDFLSDVKKYGNNPFHFAIFRKHEPNYYPKWKADYWDVDIIIRNEFSEKYYNHVINRKTKYDE